MSFQVALIDKSEIVRKMLSHCLQYFSAEVSRFDNLEACQSHFKAKKPEIVFMDSGEIKEGGKSLIDSAMLTFKPAPVVLLYREDYASQNVLTMGQIPHKIKKPLDPKAVRDVFTELIQEVKESKIHPFLRFPKTEEEKKSISQVELNTKGKKTLEKSQVTGFFNQQTEKTKKFVEKTLSGVFKGKGQAVLQNIQKKEMSQEKTPVKTSEALAHSPGEKPHDSEALASSPGSKTPVTSEALATSPGSKTHASEALVSSSGEKPLVTGSETLVLSQKQPVLEKRPFPEQSSASYSQTDKEDYKTNKVLKEKPSPKKPHSQTNKEDYEDTVIEKRPFPEEKTAYSDLNQHKKPHSNLKSKEVKSSSSNVENSDLSHVKIKKEDINIDENTQNDLAPMAIKSSGSYSGKTSAIKNLVLSDKDILRVVNKYKDSLEFQELMEKLFSDYIKGAVLSVLQNHKTEDIMGQVLKDFKEADHFKQLVEGEISQYVKKHLPEVIQEIVEREIQKIIGG